MKPILTFIFTLIYFLFLFPVLTHSAPPPPPKKHLLNLYPSNIIPPHPNATLLSNLQSYIIDDN